MADAVCGPSTALQQLQKHSSADRTIQQDRLVARTSQSEDLRSTSNYNAGILDPEFEAFQAGFRLEPSLELGPSNTALYSSAVSGEHELPPWANDFQRLGLLDEPTLSKQSDTGISAPEALNHTAAWQYDFLLQQENAKMQQSWRDSEQTPYGRGIAPVGVQQPAAYGGLGSFLSQPTSQRMQGTQQLVAQLPDETYFEQAFAAAGIELQKQELSTRSQLNSATSESNVPVVERLAQQELAKGSLRIGSDTIEDTREKETQEREDVEDELAKTAGQLLDSVKDDRSQKFRNSSFLELMRRIRDREVVVRGNDMVEEERPSNVNAVPV